MNTLLALVYADARTFVNQMRDIRRHPVRALMWAAWILALAGLFVFRLIRTSRHTHSYFNTGIRAEDVVQADFAVGIAIALFGSVLVSGNMMAGLFAHIAEARFIIGSPASPLIATLYIQLRELARRGARTLITTGYFLLVYLPRDIGPAAFARDLAFVMMAYATIAAIPLPRRLLHGAGAAGAMVVGSIVMLLAAVPIARDALTSFPTHLSAQVVPYLPEWHPGMVLFEPPTLRSLVVLAAMAAITATAVIALARAARDAYPELYALSLERFMRVERRRQRRLGGSFGRSRTALPVRGATGTSRVPGGALVSVWRAWTEYRRKNSPRSTALETSVLLIAGYLLGRIEGRNIDFLASVGFTLGQVLFVFAIIATSRLGAELRRPMFWLSGTTLFERLGALALAESWRPIAWSVLAGIGLAAGGAPALIVTGAVFAGPACVLLSTAVGFMLFSLLPNDVDQRGPLMIVRWILSYVFVAPAIAGGVLAGIALNSGFAGLLAAATAALLEAAVLVGLASWKLDRAAAVPQ